MTTTTEISAKTVLTTARARTSYCNLFSKRKNDDGTDSEWYDVMLMLEPDDPCLALAKKVFNAILRDKPELKKYRQAEIERASKPNQKPSKFKEALKDGTEMADSDPRYEVCRGKIIINARSKERQVIPHKMVGKDEDGNAILEKCEKHEFYSGCYAVARIQFYGFDKGTNKGIACSLQNIYFSAHGTPLGGGPRDAKADFKEVDTSLIEQFDNTALMKQSKEDQEDSEDELGDY